MMRGTFANVRIKNLMIPAERRRLARGRRRHAVPARRREDVHLRRGDEVHGRRHADRWSSAARNTAPARARDWAAKGTQLLGIKAVVARSFERIHRSQPGRHGRAAAAVQAAATRGNRSASTATRPSTSRSPASSGRSRTRRWSSTAPTARPARCTLIAAHRHADRGRLLPARRHPAVRAAAVAGGLTHAGRRRRLAVSVAVPRPGVAGRVGSPGRPR